MARNEPEFERQLLRSGSFNILILAGKRLGDDVQAAQTAFTEAAVTAAPNAFTVEQCSATAAPASAKESAVKKTTLTTTSLLAVNSSAR